jgi:hypothetical protein
MVSWPMSSSGSSTTFPSVTCQRAHVHNLSKHSHILRFLPSPTRYALQSGITAGLLALGESTLACVPSASQGSGSGSTSISLPQRKLCVDVGVLPTEPWLTREFDSRRTPNYQLSSTIISNFGFPSATSLLTYSRFLSPYLQIFPTVSKHESHLTCPFSQAKPTRPWTIYYNSVTKPWATGLPQHPVGRFVTHVKPAPKIPAGSKPGLSTPEALHFKIPRCMCSRRSVHPSKCSSSQKDVSYAWAGMASKMFTLQHQPSTSHRSRFLVFPSVFPGFSLPSPYSYPHLSLQE